MPLPGAGILPYVRLGLAGPALAPSRPNHPALKIPGDPAPGNKPAAWRIAAGMLVVPLVVKTVSFVFTVRIMLPVFLPVYPFSPPRRAQLSRRPVPFSPGNRTELTARFDYPGAAITGGAARTGKGRGTTNRGCPRLRAASSRKDECSFFRDQTMKPISLATATAALRTALSSGHQVKKSTECAGPDRAAQKHPRHEQPHHHAYPKGNREPQV